ncbi:uncharacterized protein KGF55_002683 [Candida pseudojiufengensis]|uniref:uncharacterized protein n=1 Tax=Candida pseudojiufengensis TaxID=497109 RepID=UPI00222565D8|nr:uncharacterized protein KGF55_002683 [Candida pseudojiufengensis]KAI5963803.1 hypothetical protein KGF55_002683 [Candida pseudojiufengensis]
MEAIKRRIHSSDHHDSIDNNNANLVRVASATRDAENLDGLSPELIPIVTLLSSQSHRRYTEGIFMLYYDLNGDGKPADREWKEIYGILTGCQLAYWDAANLAQFKNNPDALLEFSAKPNYINFTDSIYNAMKSLPAAKQNLDNVIIVSTTLKNRYILQFKSYRDLTQWYSALRLSNYEYKSLQEAYTGALLSARGSRLSDIKTILAEKRFDHEDWVSIRYGSGMAWKRCYAVIEPSVTKKKTFIPGRILIFENEQKKKKQLMAVITNASAVSAVYPQSHLLIDHSTMLKMEGYINFTSPSLSTKISKKSAEDFRQTSIFIMPEQHSAVPGFDTLIRFLIPLLDSFGLYGRPKRLKANRNDIDSLLFGLPTLPRVHYLELQDILQLITREDFLNWDLKTWNEQIQSLLKSKIERGYEGCGSQRGYAGAVSSLNSPTLSSSPRLSSSGSQFSGSRKPVPTSSLSQSVSNSTNNSAPELKEQHKGFSKNPNNLSLNVPTITTYNGKENKNKIDLHKSVQLADIYQGYSDLKTPSDNYIDRSKILNGAPEELNENDFPAGFQQLNLSDSSKNTYPKNDDGLFSDDDDEEAELGSQKRNSNLVDVRQIGLKNLPNGSDASLGNLKVPGFQDKNSSYSSVISPMTQFNDLKDSYKRVENIPNYGLKTESPPPPVPQHTTTSIEDRFGGTLNEVSQRTPVTENFKGQRSIHSESGRVSSGSSSDSITKKEGSISPQKPLPYPVNKPRFISSPNSSQNQINKFPSNDVKKSLQYPLSPSNVNNRSRDQLNEVEQSKPRVTTIPKSNKQIFSPSIQPSAQLPTSQDKNATYQVSNINTFGKQQHPQSSGPSIAQKQQQQQQQQQQQLYSQQNKNQQPVPVIQQPQQYQSHPNSHQRKPPSELNNSYPVQQQQYSQTPHSHPIQQHATHLHQSSKPLPQQPQQTRQKPINPHQQQQQPGLYSNPINNGSRQNTSIPSQNTQPHQQPQQYQSNGVPGHQQIANHLQNRNQYGSNMPNQQRSNQNINLRAYENQQYQYSTNYQPHHPYQGQPQHPAQGQVHPQQQQQQQQQQQSQSKHPYAQYSQQNSGNFGQY